MCKSIHFTPSPLSLSIKHFFISVFENLYFQLSRSISTTVRRRFNQKTYQNTIGKAYENSENKSKSSEFSWTNMTNISLAYNSDTKAWKPSEYGWCCHCPHQLALFPHLVHQRWFLFWCFLFDEQLLLLISLHFFGLVQELV